MTSLLLTCGMLHLHLQGLLVHMLLCVYARQTHLHIWYIEEIPSSVVKRHYVSLTALVGLTNHNTFVTITVDGTTGITLITLTVAIVPL